MYDAGQSVSWSHISWAETLPANTDVQFQVALSNSLSGPWTYLGPDGTAGTFFTTASGETLPATAAFQGRYARFQARLSSSDGQHTPSFGNVHLSFTGAGLLASSCHNFAYDPAGNITSIETVTDSGTTVDDRNPVANPINALNQVLQRDVNGVTWLYSWDLSGNLLWKTNGIDTFLNTWNDLNQLTRVQGPGGLDVAYTYDTSGRMLTRTSGGVTRRFTWSGWDCVKEETGSSVTIYHIPDGTLHSFAVDGAVFQCHLDALGSVRMITDASGAVVARIEYGAWGEETFVSAIPALADFPYRFVGSLGVRTDEETGLVYMRQRWYDPKLARFISRDPIGLNGGDNLYSYGINSPQNLNDPMGLTPLTREEAGEIWKLLRKVGCNMGVPPKLLIAIWTLEGRRHLNGQWQNTPTREYGKSIANMVNIGGAEGLIDVNSGGTTGMMGMSPTTAAYLDGRITAPGRWTDFSSSERRLMFGRQLSSFERVNYMAGLENPLTSGLYAAKNLLYLDSIVFPNQQMRELSNQQLAKLAEWYNSGSTGNPKYYKDVLDIMNNQLTRPEFSEYCKCP